MRNSFNEFPLERNVINNEVKKAVEMPLFFIHIILHKNTRSFYMRLLFIGDVVGSPGREMVKEYVPRLKEKYRPQVTIVNGENAAAGKGITEKIYKQFLQQ